MAKRPVMEVYEKELRYFELATKANMGIRIGPLPKGQAINLRLKMNKLRSAIREQNKMIYPIYDPRHGVTPFDEITVSLYGDNADFFVTLTRKKEETITEL